MILTSGRQFDLANAMLAAAAPTDDHTHVALLTAIRLIWQAGHERWNWPPLGVDQEPALDRIERLKFKRKRGWKRPDLRKAKK